MLTKDFKDQKLGTYFETKPYFESIGKDTCHLKTICKIESVPSKHTELAVLFIICHCLNVYIVKIYDSCLYLNHFCKYAT